MSVSGVSISLFNTQTTQTNIQKAQQEFQKLGKDLESGNLSAAQTDFATLQNLAPPSSFTTTSTSQSNSPMPRLSPNWARISSPATSQRHGRISLPSSRIFKIKHLSHKRICLINWGKR